MSRDKIKERDKNAREKLLREINKSRDYLKNIQEELKSSNETAGIRALKRTLDELDIFSKEIDLSEVGHKYPLFSPQKSASGHRIKKLSKFDKSIVTKMADVTEASKRVQKALIDNKPMNIFEELEKIRHYITKARTQYKDRMDIIKGVK